MTVKKRPKSLSHGRPPLSKTIERMTSDQSRTIIRTHHQLQKEHAAALKNGNTKAAADLALAIEKNGGIRRYQAASKQGQANDRGGDSSKVLVEWLQAAQLIDLKARRGRDSGTASFRCLEIGALSIRNEISQYPSMINMTRIDLNSQSSGIEKQDFMARPVPTCEDECFDIISLSLVLNYVPDPIGRGEMLKRLLQFLRKTNQETGHSPSVLPIVFLVLPLPCIQNSRYCDEELLLQIMSNLGFALRLSKHTSKISYHIFSWTRLPNDVKTPKKKVKDGPAMNNFSIIIR